MPSLTINTDSMVPISQFSRGSAGSAFAKAQNGHPVTVMRNNQAAYFILTPDDLERYQALEREVIELRNEEARRQVRDHDYMQSFSNADELGTYLDEL